MHTRLFVATGALLLASLGCREDTEPPTASEPELDVAPSQVLAFRRVTAGDGFTCGLTTAGLAYCWGSNEVGALGIGDRPGPEACSGLPCSTTPVRVVGGLVFRQLSAGWVHACGVTPNNRLFCWGHNHTGQLGDGTAADSPRPIRIARGLAFRQVSAGDLHTCAVTTDGAAYCWGHNQLGPLGDGTTDGSSLPVRVVGGLAFREVAAGNQFTCGVTTADVAYCWGAGIGNNTGESCFGGDGFSPCSTRPVRVLRRLPFSRLSAGLGHVCGVTTEAVAYCWGSNDDGQLGHDTLPGLDPSTGVCSPTDFCSSEKPVRVVGGLAFGSVSAGQSHTCGVTTDHLAYCWGENFFGQLGTGDDSGPDTCLYLGDTCSGRPVRVVGGLAFSEVSAGVSHTCGVATTGNVYCWGDNEFGQLGDGTTRDRLRPRRVAGGS
jgi:alpha-tubulin suppressor-like RCC1 family protein